MFSNSIICSIDWKKYCFDKVPTQLDSSFERNKMRENKS